MSSTWFAEALRDAERGAGTEIFAARWSGLGRRFGRASVIMAGAEGEALAVVSGQVLGDGWALDEAGRAALLMCGLAATAVGRHLRIVAELFRTGEVREQRALARVLAFLPQPERFSEIAVEAIRINAASVFEGIACDNPYPATHLAEGAFNQMVVKALFNGISVARIRGLAQRRTPELIRMVTALSSERLAAGRAVPQDAALITKGQADAAV